MPEDPWSGDYDKDLEHLQSLGRWNALAGLLFAAAVIGAVVLVVMIARMLFSGDYCWVECGV